MISTQLSVPLYAQALSNLHGMVICANSASHLWPLSRAHTPLELIPDAAQGESPLAKAIGALRPYCEGRLLIATPQEIAPCVQAHIEEYALLKPGEYQLLVEPHPRGTALTCALAAATVKLADPHATLVCLPANIAFDADSRWEHALKKAHQAVGLGRIAVIGSSVPPLSRYQQDKGRPSVHQTTQALDIEENIPLLGTIRLGAPHPDIEGVFKVRSFIARPAPAVAWRAQQSRSLWNTHIFMLKADLALAEMRAAEHASDEPRLRAVTRIAETARFFVSLGDEHWGSKEAVKLLETLPELSFEEAVFETSAALAAVPTSIEFADLTSLSGYERSIEPDAKGNRTRGNTLALQSRNTTILADAGKLVVTLGLDDALVIDTPDATLIASKQALAAMPSVIAALRNTNAPEL
ncbi:MAG: hypothetical protein FWF91_06185 [Coriobacteriia bacterium]|nr:hypothetical protein [Coriobacteriia bacterium]